MNRRRQRPYNHPWSRDRLDNLLDQLQDLHGNRYSAADLKTRDLVSRSQQSIFFNLRNALWDDRTFESVRFDFMRGIPQIARFAHEPPDNEGEWRVKRFLGAGGQGAAAQWERTDAQGQIVDELVIKMSKKGVAHHDRHNQIREAAFQLECNAEGCESK